MSLPIHKAEAFVVDAASHFAWYVEQTGEEVAWRFVAAVEATLESLSAHPGQGRVRRFRHPMLQGVHSFRVEAPFDRFLIFYHIEVDALQAWRLLHGARNLPERLAESPSS